MREQDTGLRAAHCRQLRKPSFPPSSGHATHISEKGESSPARPRPSTRSPWRDEEHQTSEMLLGLWIQATGEGERAPPCAPGLVFPLPRVQIESSKMAVTRQDHGPDFRYKPINLLPLLFFNLRLPNFRQTIPQGIYENIGGAIRTFFV